MAAWPRPDHKQALLLLLSLNRILPPLQDERLLKASEKGILPFMLKPHGKWDLSAAACAGREAPFLNGRNRVLAVFYARFWFTSGSPVTSETEDSP